MDSSAEDSTTSTITYQETPAPLPTLRSRTTAGTASSSENAPPFSRPENSSSRDHQGSSRASHCHGHPTRASTSSTIPPRSRESKPSPPRLLRQRHTPINRVSPPPPCSPLPPRTLTSSQLLLFWDRSSIFSQWYPSTFTVDTEHYCCAEHYMMSEKVKLFGNTITHRDIMGSSDPVRQKNLGRLVSNFNQTLWKLHRWDVVFNGNLAKFSFPPSLQQLIGTGDKILAEASPHDLIWGIGFRAEDMRAFRPPLFQPFGRHPHEDPPPA